MLTYCYICVVYESCWKSRKWRIKLFKKKYLNDSLLLSFQCFQIHLHTYLVGCKSFRESDVFSMSYLFFLWQWTIFQFLSLSLSLSAFYLYFSTSCTFTTFSFRLSFSLSSELWKVSNMGSVDMKKRHYVNELLIIFTSKIYRVS